MWAKYCGDDNGDAVDLTSKQVCDLCQQTGQLYTDDEMDTFCGKSVFS